MSPELKKISLSKVRIANHESSVLLDLKAISQLIFLLQYRQKSTSYQGEEKELFSQFSFQSISLPAQFKKVPCQNLSLVNENWESCPSKVNMMRCKPAGVQSRHQNSPSSFSFTHFFFLVNQKCLPHWKKLIGAKQKRLR